MLWTRLKSRLSAYRKDESGSAVVEASIAVPIILLAFAAAYEFFELYRFQGAREKAAHTVADMLSREQSPVNDTYIDNAKILFDTISNDDGVNQMRITVIKYLEGTDTYDVSWSEVRGQGSMSAMTTTDAQAARATLPSLRDGEELILVETQSTYQAFFTSIFANGVSTDTRVFTSLRFAPQLCFENCSS
jgi:Flp pilus assembly protein TadG